MLYKEYRSERLILKPIQNTDTSFVIELLNTPQWIKFIGDRNVRDKSTALIYISRFLNNEKALFWVVAKDDGEPIGAITLIQRDYLPHPDIGFSFLPQFAKKGYAFEAAQSIIDGIKEHNPDQVTLAMTLTFNENSIKLIEKLGLKLISSIEVDNEAHFLYSTEAITI